MTKAILPEFAAFRRSAEKMYDFLLRHRDFWCDARRQDRTGVQMLVVLESGRHAFEIGPVSVGDADEFAAIAGMLLEQIESADVWSTGELSSQPVGVAIRTKVGLLLIVGLSKALDEVLALMIAVDMGHLNRARARWVLEQRSNNPHAGLLSQVLGPQNT